jgi:hypothetical protein
MLTVSSKLIITKLRITQHNLVIDLPVLVADLKGWWSPLHMQVLILLLSLASVMHVHGII